MAATVAPSQSIPPGLHPLQAAALRAAANAQQQQAQQPQQPPQRHFDDEPFDVTSRKLTLRDFVRVRTLGTGTSPEVSLQHDHARTVSYLRVQAPSPVFVLSAHPTAPKPTAARSMR